MSLRSSATHIVIFDFYRGERIGGYYALPSSLPRTCSMRKQPLFRDVTTGFQRNDVWETSEEIPYWRRNTIEIWVMFLIGRKFASTNQKYYPDLGSDASSVWNFYSFLRRHFAEKPVVASQNSGRVFLRLSNLELARRWDVMGLMVWVTAALPCEIKFFSNFDRNSKYNKSSEVRASSPTTAFMACTSLPMA